MKRILAVSIVLLMTGAAFAGNPDRAGSAGAGHLLVNPWSRSSGMANASMASVTGVEGTFLNVASLAFIKKTELVFSNSNYLTGAGIKLNGFGFGQKVGESGALGLTVSSMNFGDINITEEALPEGGIGSYRPSFTNIGLSYAKGFSNSIYGGLTVRMISEAIYNVKSQGFCFDAGIRYVTGEKDNIRFGISLRNVGPPMRFRGDGLSTTATVSNGTSMTVEQRTEKYELPSLVNLGVSYDFIFSEKSKLTTDIAYTSNSFTRDQLNLGVQYGWNNRFFLRGGYMKEAGKDGERVSSSVFTGPTGGMTIQMPVGKSESVLGLDYSYRVTNPFGGVHSIGLHLSL
jgi:hypothetical protein